MIRSQSSVRQVVCVLMCALLCSSSAGAKPGKPSKDTVLAWVAEQNTSMVGPQTVYVTRDDFKLVMRSLHVGLLISGPEHTVTLYNEVSRKYIDVPASDAKGMFSFQRNQKLGRGERDFHEVPIREASSTMLGRHVVEYIYPHNPTFLMDPKNGDRLSRLTQEQKQLTGEDKRLYNLIKHHQRREFWVATDIEVPEQIAPVFGIDSNIEQAMKLPLKMVQVSKAGDRATAIETVSLKHAAVPASIFTHPKGYARAANQMEILMDDSSPQDETDMFGAKVKKSTDDAEEARTKMQDALRTLSGSKKGGK